MLKKIGIVLITLFAIFVLWMNVTPGHFQSSCCGKIIYQQHDIDDPLYSDMCSIGFCTPSFSVFFAPLFVTASYIDFYK